MPQSPHAFLLAALLASACPAAASPPVPPVVRENMVIITNACRHPVTFFIRHKPFEDGEWVNTGWYPFQPFTRNFLRVTAAGGAPLIHQYHLPLFIYGRVTNNPGITWEGRGQANTVRTTYEGRPYRLMLIANNGDLAEEKTYTATLTCDNF